MTGDTRETALEEHPQRFAARCPRCGSAFACCPALPFQCDCRKVTLTQAERTALHVRYGDRCLCTSCLLQIRAAEHPSQETELS